jgi:iron(III) transport system substrate-binding protein
VIAVLLALVAGCGRHDSPEVVVYCALDREFSEPILRQFERDTGVRVLAKFDTESTKSVGLAEQILREKSRPRCDVFWNNEVLHTVRLQQAGLTSRLELKARDDYPSDSRSPTEDWFGLAARVRVLLVNTDRVAAGDEPTTLEDLANPRWKGQVGIAKPLFGTTATQVACLFWSMGDKRARELLGHWKDNEIQILAGNKQVAVDVGQGTLAMGLTDTDDALGEIRAGRPVKIIYLDAREGERGILLIPNTLSAIKGSPHPEEARRLIDYLLTVAVEERLSRGASGQIPLHRQAHADSELTWPSKAPRMRVDWHAVADHWQEAVNFVAREFASP